MDPSDMKTGTLPIKVNKDVVRHLSLGLYRNFALAVKELISNSYDAGATEVKIKLDLKDRRITVRDNGKGMSLEEFGSEYLNIGYFKPPTIKVDELGRMRIGMFGIGFLAPLPYCGILRVITKKVQSNKMLEASILAEKFFRKGSWDIREEKVPYSLHDSDLPEKAGETITILEDIKPQILEDLSRKESPGKSKIDQFGGFEKFRWTLAQYAPIQFPPDRNELREFFEESSVVPMRLWLQGEELFRNVPDNAEILEKDEKKFGDIRLKYAILTTYEPIKPEEARGLQIRLRNVAIGFPREFDVTKLGRVLGKLNFLCGEVHILEGLDNVLMVNRDNFNYTQEVAEIFEFFRKRLTFWNDTLYEQADSDRKVYDSLGRLREDENIVATLQKTKIVHFAKARLRFQESPIVRTSKIKVDVPSKRILEALSEVKPKDYKLTASRIGKSKGKPPIELRPDEKSIVVYEDHPDLIEKVHVLDRVFGVRYEAWDPGRTAHSVCRLADDENTVIYNTSHPLFESRLSDEIVKRLSLGIVLVTRDRKDADDLVAKLNDLLLDVFKGQEDV